ncbi:MAG: DUF4838 domain-containing protein, partial [Methylococcaceae bacterium]
AFSAWAILLFVSALPFAAQGEATQPRSDFTAAKAALIPASSKANATFAASHHPTVIIARHVASEALSDLKKELANYEAGTIRIEQVALAGRTGQEFYLKRNGYDAVIKYTTHESLENAIYTLLESMGFRWYGPGENWTIRPAKIKLSNKSGGWTAPSFRNRFFSGTGGLDLAEPAGVDENESYKKQWLQWKRRLRINGDFEPQGHTGEAFYLENKALLDAHPQWFNSKSGRLGGRFRVEIPAALQAYKDWIFDKYSAEIGKSFVAIGTEPEDGKGGIDDPLPPVETHLLNHADKWWYVTNEVAKMYNENDPMTVITAYAYGSGSTAALAPSFDLRKNVYPVLTPYAFQTAYIPEEMIVEWSKRVEKMGIYDYWNITAWSYGVPGFDIYGMKEKLKFWHTNKIDGIYIETTDGAGAMGHAWWLGSQLMFDMGKNFDALYSQYLQDCFGPAAPVMRRMYDRWSNNYQERGDVSQSLADLRDATELVEYGGAEWKRLNELKAYVHYMKLFYEHDGTQAGKDAIFQYLYSIHHLMMVQTAAFQSQSYLQPLVNDVNVFPKGVGKVLSVDEIEANFALDLMSNPQLYVVLPFSFELDKADFLHQADKMAWRYGGDVSMQFKVKQTGNLVFNAGSTDTATLEIFNKSTILLKESIGVDNTTFTETLDGQDWFMKHYSLPVQAGQEYSLHFTGYFNRLTMQSKIPLFKRIGEADFDAVGYPSVYFYVPKSATEIVFHDELGSVDDPLGSIMIDPKGAVHPREDTGIKDLYRVAVPSALRGKVWKAQFTHSLWSIKNFAGIGSLAPFRYRE